MTITEHVDGILQKGPTRHVYAWQIGPFWQDTLDVADIELSKDTPWLAPYRWAMACVLCWS